MQTCQIEKPVNNGQHLLYGAGRDLSRQRREQGILLRQQQEERLRQSLQDRLEDLYSQGADAEGVSIDEYLQIFEPDATEKSLAEMKAASHELAQAESRVGRFSWTFEVIIPALIGGVVNALFIRLIGIWAMVLVAAAVAGFIIFRQKRDLGRLHQVHDLREHYYRASDSYKNLCRLLVTFDPEELTRRDKIEGLRGRIAVLSSDAGGDQTLVDSKTA